MGFKTESYSGGGVCIDGARYGVNCDYGIKWYTGLYPYTYKTTIVFNYSRTVVKSVNFTIVISNYDIKYSLEEQFINELNEIPNPSNVISKHARLIVCLQIMKHVHRMDEEAYGVELAKLHSKIFD